MDKKGNRKHTAVISEAFIIAFISCIIEIIFAYAFDELSFYTWIYRNQPGIRLFKIIEFVCIFVFPFTILITNAINYVRHRLKRNGTYALTGAISGIFNILLLLTLFQIACYILKIGTAFEEGLLLVAQWAVAIVVSALYAVVSIIVSRHAKSHNS